MANIECKHPLKWMTLLGLGLALAGATTPLVIASTIASPFPSCQVDGDDNVADAVPLLTQVATDLRRWAWGPAQDPIELGQLVDTLVAAAAAEPDVEVWADAHPAAALAEASLRLAGRDRSGLAASTRALGYSAPDEEQRVNAVRTELRLLEAVVTASVVQVASGRSGGAQPDGSQPGGPTLADLARLRVQEILANEEHLEGNLPSQLSRLRERTGRRLDTLAVGHLFPRFLARDAAGNEVRSSLMAGRVTILRFWEKGSPTSMLVHEADVRLVRRFWDAPVALFGASQSNDRAEHLELIQSRAFAGTQIFDGPISTALSDELAKGGDALSHGAGWSTAVGIYEAWSRPTAGSLFVIDEAGVIRGRDLLTEELEDLVSQLVAERRARLRLEGERRFIGTSSR